MLGVGPSVGRNFDAADDVSGAPPVAIVTASFATRHFGSVAAALDRQSRSTAKPIPSSASCPRIRERFEPGRRSLGAAAVSAHAPFQSGEWGHHLRMIGRLRGGVRSSRRSATRRDRELAGGRLSACARSAVRARTRPCIAAGVSYRRRAPGAARDLGRGAAAARDRVRQCREHHARPCARAPRELAIRAAVGAEQHLVRRLFAESALVAVAGGLLGVGIAAVVAARCCYLRPRVAAPGRGWSRRARPGLRVRCDGGRGPRGRTRTGITCRASSAHVRGCTTGRASDITGSLRCCVVFGRRAGGDGDRAAGGCGLLLRSVGHCSTFRRASTAREPWTLQVVATATGTRSSEETASSTSGCSMRFAPCPGSDAALTSQFPLTAARRGPPCGIPRPHSSGPEQARRRVSLRGYTGLVRHDGDSARTRAVVGRRRTGRGRRHPYSSRVVCGAPFSGPDPIGAAGLDGARLLRSEPPATSSASSAT